MVAGKKKDKLMIGKKRRQQKSTFRNSIGMTALLFRDIFLITSYNPSRKAEIKAKNNHINREFGCKGKNSECLKKRLCKVIYFSSI